MNSPSLAVGISPRLKVIGLLGLLIVSLPFTSRADLLFERHQGGPNQWNGGGRIHYAGFHLTEATRITGITGWMSGPTMIALSITSVPNPQGNDVNFFTSFGSLPAYEGERLTPGIWQGVDSLSWDLPIGNYELTIEGASMPYSYGYFGPVSDAATFDYFGTYFPHEDRVSGLGQPPFGARLYGSALTAVPEPSVTGAAGVIMLLSIIVYQRRRTSRLVPAI